MTKRLLVVAVVAGCDPNASELPDAALSDAVVPIGCGAPTGTLRERMLHDGQEPRAFWLHVPASYRCESPAPLLVDFHGTAGDVPEEAYQTAALIAFSEAHGVIVARPRSRSAPFGGTNIYRWDQNPGDLPRNVTFTRTLVTTLTGLYAIDPARIYASGFSSGANMTAQFLSEPDSPFVGLAPIAGGRWTSQPLVPLADGPRLWMATGYRDYLWPSARSLSDAVAAAGLPADRWFVRRTVGGHDLYAWHFEELWAFLDGGTRPEDLPLAAPWTAQPLPSAGDVTSLVRDGTGLLAAGARGRVWKRAAAGDWTLDVERGADHAALCVGTTRALVGGSHRIADRNGATWSTARTFPDYGMLSSGWANTALCRDDGSIVVAGYWSAARSTDGGQTWSRFQIPSMYPGVEAQIAGGAQAPGGATVLVGYYDYIGRAANGASSTTPVAHGASAEWWNAATAIAGGRFWVVGDGGAIMTSSDDGQTWTAQQSGTTESLYGVHFFDALHGAAVGRRGTVLVTSTGGAQWTARPLGKDCFVGGVVVDATTITVAGEDGLIASSAR